MNAKTGFILIALMMFSLCSMPETSSKKLPTSMKQIDWQGHRGARGLLPENSIPAFLLALSFPKISSLELDVVVSKDEQIIISHEPFFSHHISSHPTGKPVLEAEALSLNIYEMLAEDIGKYDVGKRGNEDFPDQVAMPINKPTLQAMVRAVKSFCEKNKRPLPGFNIELKSSPEAYDIYFPQPEKFVSLLVAELKDLQILEKVNLQSFDTNVLETIHKYDPNISTALLVEEVRTFEDHLSSISYTPTIFSPYFELVTSDVIYQAKAKNIKVIPWTVNELKDMQRMIDLGVDGIITDYPNRIDLLNLGSNN